MNYKCLNDLERDIESKYGGDIILPAEICPQGMNGDITVNCYRLGKILAWRPCVLCFLR